MCKSVKMHEVNDIAQTVSSRLRTALARVQSTISSCGICGAQSGTGAGFFQVTSISLANSHSMRRFTLINYPIKETVECKH
jgi:hypothetical protein